MAISNKLIIGIGAAVVAFFIGKKILDKKQTVDALNVNVTGIDFNKKNKTLQILMRIINGGNSSIFIQSIVGDIKFSGNSIASIDYRQPLTILQNDTAIISIAVKPNAAFLMALLAIVVGKPVNGLLEINGNINSEGLLFPFIYSQKINWQKSNKKILKDGFKK